MTEGRTGTRLAAYAALSLWCAGLAIAGILFISEPWGVVCLGAALLSGVIVGIGAAFRMWMAPLYGVLLIAGASVAVAGAMVSESTLVGAGVLTLAFAGASAPLALLLRGIAARDGTKTDEQHGQLRDLLRELHEHSMLSDSAKRVLFRERELGLLRHAIEADIEVGKYNVALTLCDEMANVFGYREEAEAFRGRILQARQKRFEADVQAALARLDELLARKDWAMVHQEAARIRRLYGDSHLVQDLEQRITLARDEHKRELEGQFLRAAERDDVEGAMALLRQLDRYLGPEEAERLTEVAQGVVVRHRENLGVQFKLAVNDRRWAEAAQIGEVIIDEFPNTKMANEVRSMIDVLRTRAEQTVT